MTETKVVKYGKYIASFFSGGAFGIFSLLAIQSPAIELSLFFWIGAVLYLFLFYFIITAKR